MQVMARSSHAACHSFFTVRRATCDCSAALDGAGIDAHLPHPIEIQRNADIWQQWAAGQMRNPVAGVRNARCIAPNFIVFDRH